MRHLLRFLSVVLALAGCAERQEYWTRSGADERAFRRASRTCNEAAQIQVFEEARDGCTLSSSRPGCSRSRSGPEVPFPEEAEKRQQERRRRYLYGQCLESKGWVRNYEERGYKGR